MDIVSVVVTVRQRLDISLRDGRFFGELILQHVHRFFQRTFEQPANQPQCEHILTTENRFIVQSGIFQTFFAHRRDGHFQHFLFNA